MDTLSNILKYIRLPLSLFAFVLSAPQAAQISDKERYLLCSSAHYKYDDNKNVSEKNELEKAFLKAAKEGNIELLKALKTKGTNVHTKDQSGKNALHYAALYAPEGRGIAWLIDSAHIPIEAKGRYKKTPFIGAAEKGNLAALKILQARGANVHATDQYGNNALHYASLYAPEGKSITWLIDFAKIPIEVKGQYQKTPFLCAAQKGNLIALKILKDKGANVYVKDKNGDNALHYAAFCNSGTQVISWLIHKTNIPIETKGKKYQCTPFLYAAQKGNVLALKLLKEKGANVQAKTQNGKNALHLASLYAPEGKGIAWLIDSAHIPIETKGQYQETPFLCAARKGNLPALKILKAKGANVHAKSQDGKNALHYASLYVPEGEGIVWLIDSANVSIEAKGPYQRTPFLCAARKGNLVVLKMLKRKGANVYAKDQYGNNALHIAAMFGGDRKTIAWLIDSAKIPIESKGQYQKTAFVCAAQKSNLPALKLLKEKGANVYAKDQYDNNALHLVAFYAREEKVITWLIDFAKIPIETKGQYQKTPLLCAAKNSNLIALKFLQKKGANIYAKERYGYNALHYAAMFAKKEAIIIWLIDFVKIPIEVKGGYQKTPFLCAANNGNLVALESLKKKGANLHAKDRYGNTALHIAAMFAPEGKGITWLIDSAHIPIETKGQYETTPFLCTAEKGNLTALKILKNKGANIHAKDKNGNNALYYAKKYSNNKNVIDWLKNVCQL